MRSSPRNGGGMSYDFRVWVLVCYLHTISGITSDGPWRSAAKSTVMMSPVACCNPLNVFRNGQNFEH